MAIFWLNVEFRMFSVFSFWIYSLGIKAAKLVEYLMVLEVAIPVLNNHIFCTNITFENFDIAHPALNFHDERISLSKKGGKNKASVYLCTWKIGFKKTIVYLTVEETIYKDNYITKEFNDKNIQKKEEYL